jgi:hypothetical protein
MHKHTHLLRMLKLSVGTLMQCEMALANALQIHGKRMANALHKHSKHIAKHGTHTAKAQQIVGRIAMHLPCCCHIWAMYLTMYSLCVAVCLQCFRLAPRSVAESVPHGHQMEQRCIHRKLACANLEERKRHTKRTGLKSSKIFSLALR